MISKRSIRVQNTLSKAGDQVFYASGVGKQQYQKKAEVYVGSVIIILDIVDSSLLKYPPASQQLGQSRITRGTPIKTVTYKSFDEAMNRDKLKWKIFSKINLIGYKY